jgi:hypothetical protein
MRRAALDLVDILEAFAAAGGHPVRDLLAAAPDALLHYPAGDVQDSTTGSIWYYHAHERDWDEHGHFHCFLYTELVRRGARPIALPEQPDFENGGLVHLVGVCFDVSGVPTRLFTINRWASGEWMYPARDVIPLIDRFKFGSGTPFPLTGRLLSATLRVLHPQVTWALRERDRVLDERRKLDPAGFSENSSIEVTSELTFNLDDHLAALERAWARKASRHAA